MYVLGTILKCLKILPDWVKMAKITTKNHELSLCALYENQKYSSLLSPVQYVVYRRRWGHPDSHSRTLHCHTLLTSAIICLMDKLLCWNSLLPHL